MERGDRVSLKSDYHDCYDVWLDRPDPGAVVFSRWAQDSWSVHRTAMFDLFERLGLAHPAFQRAETFDPGDEIVLYDDPFSHCGEGKTLTTAGAAVARGQGGLHASAFIPDFPGMSYRYFVIAGHGAWFEHWSTDDWRSNCGDGDLAPLSLARGPIQNLEAIEASCRPITNPVYAIDFVARQELGGLILLAIDWNPAPRLAGTPAQEAMASHWGGNMGIAQAIKEAVLAEARKAGTILLDNNKIMVGNG